MYVRPNAGRPKPKQSSNANYDDGKEAFTKPNEYSRLTCKHYSLKAKRTLVNIIQYVAGGKVLIKIHKCSLSLRRIKECAMSSVRIFNSGCMRIVEGARK